MNEIDEELRRRGMMEYAASWKEEELKQLIEVGQMRIKNGYTSPKPTSIEKLEAARALLPEAVRPYLTLIEDQIGTDDVYLILIPGMLAVGVIFTAYVCDRIRFRIQIAPFIAKRYHDIESALAAAVPAYEKSMETA